MIALDSSVLVPAFATWHEAHAKARASLLEKPRLPAHAGIEAFSVLTRMPAPHRPSPKVVADFLRDNFPGSPLTLSAEGYALLIKEAPARGIAGGAIYDALIAATAREAGATLLSRDLRAAATYELMGVAFELLT